VGREIGGITGKNYALYKTLYSPCLLPHLRQGGMSKKRKGSRGGGDRFKGRSSWKGGSDEIELREVK
jgi:hypothetical protein